jgi:hypothetical protein
MLAGGGTDAWYKQWPPTVSIPVVVDGFPIDSLVRGAESGSDGCLNCWPRPANWQIEPMKNNIDEKPRCAVYEV